MNTTIRNLMIAAPLATAALTMVPAAAMATEPARHHRPAAHRPAARPQHRSGPEADEAEGPGRPR